MAPDADYDARPCDQAMFGRGEDFQKAHAVEGWNYAVDGEPHHTVFFGAYARERAEEYAAWKRVQRGLRPSKF